MPALLKLAAGIAASAAVVRLVYGAPFLNPDFMHSLVWGAAIADGARPSFEDASTPHPLSMLLSTVVALAGPAAVPIARALALLFAGAALTATYAVGRRLGGPRTGLVGAGLLGAASPWVTAGYYDMLALALLLAAVAAVIDGRPRPAGVALLLAGLLRPDYWALTALFVAWLWWTRPEGARPAGAVAAAAPPVWLLVDWVMTGDPLFGLTHTQALAGELGRTTGLASVPGAYVGGIASAVTAATALAGVLGLGLAAAHRRLAAVPMGVVLAAGLASFAVLGAAGLSLLPRYLAPTGAMLAVFAGYAVALTARRSRATVAVTLAAVAVLVASVPQRIADASRTRTLNGNLVAVADDLRRLAQALPRCGPVRIPSPHGPAAPIVAHELGLPVAELRRSGEPGAVDIVPVSRRARAFANGPPPGGVPAAPPALRTGHWRAVAIAC